MKTSGAKGLHVFVPVADAPLGGFGGRYPGHRGASGGARPRDSHDRVS